MRFTKMQALGNDYIYINAIDQKIENHSELAIFMSDRHFGVGSDGLILICDSEVADFRMRMYNPDGTEAEICGNAIRSVGKYVYDNSLTTKTLVKIETLAGIKDIYLTIKDNKVSMISADMGVPILDPAKIPVVTNAEQFINQPIDIAGRIFFVSAVSMGNPHAVAFIHDVDNFDLEKYGRALEHHPLFPRKTNTEFASIIDRNHIKM